MIRTGQVVETTYNIRFPVERYLARGVSLVFPRLSIIGRLFKSQFQCSVSSQSGPTKDTLKISQISKQAEWAKRKEAKIIR